MVKLLMNKNKRQKQKRRPSDTYRSKHWMDAVVQKSWKTVAGPSLDPLAKHLAENVPDVGVLLFEGWFSL